MSSTIQIKRGPSSNLNELVLTLGEPAFTTDTKKLYIGDGVQKTLINPMDKPEGLDTNNQYTKIKVNEYGQVVNLSNLEATDLPTNIPVEKITGLGSVATKNVGTASGEIPILDVNGKLNTSVVPSIAITDTYVVVSQEEMLKLDAQTGDICIRTDVKKTFILKAEPANVIGNWIELETPADAVQSVNGQKGNVVLSSANISLTGYAKPATGGSVADTDTITNAIGKLEKNADSYAPISNPTFTGIPQAPTATAGTNTTQLATTQFVMSAVSNIDGGTF